MTAALAEDLDVLRRAGLLRTLSRATHRRDGHVTLDGASLVDFASNDYLGLASHPQLAAAVADVLAADATGAAAARTIAGNHDLHEALEEALATFKHAEAALLFPSGYAANAGAIPALTGSRDVIYSDALNHASIIDGCRLSRATVRTVPHRDVDAMAELLEADRDAFRRRLIVVEGVYSMDGDLAPLPALIDLAREHDAWLYVDDAHATGVLGATGTGAAEYWGVAGDVPITMGTLGKALGTSGAFIAGPAELRDLLINRARTFIFTTGSPPAIAAAALAALRLLAEEPWRRERLAANIDRVREGLLALGFAIDHDAPGHIVPIVLREAERTMHAARRLRARGILVGAVRPPTVPMGGARLRLTVSAAHSPEQIDHLLAALADIIPHDGVARAGGAA